MFKNNCIVFIMLMIALLSFSTVSAEESSLEVTDTDNTDLMDDSGTEVIASAHEKETSLGATSKEDSKLHNTTDVKSDKNNNSKTFEELDNTINSANGTLTIDSNYKLTTSGNFETGIKISKNITIEGNGFTIDANGLGRIFNIGGGLTVTLANLTLVNGKTIKSGGGAIYNGGNLLLKNVTFVNNTQLGDGGAVYSTGSGLTVLGCTFVNNSAIEDGAAIWGDSSGLVSDCVFINNSAREYGGAIYILSLNIFNASSFNVSGCVFVNNSARECGGAIWNYMDSVVIDNCSFINNNASCGGAIYSGGIYNYEGSVVIDNCSFINNNASGGGAIYNFGSGSASDCVFVNNSASSDGGAICNDGSSFTLRNCTFEQNSAGKGGAICNSHYKLVVNDCIFVNNSASSDGGAIYGGLNSYGLDVLGCVFVNNSASSDGGAIYNYGSAFNASNSVFLDNNATKGNMIYNYIESCTISDNWWGSNTPIWAELVYADECKVICDSYAVLNLKVTDDKIDVNFYRNRTAEILPFSRDVSLTVGNDKFSGRIVNGTYKTNYTAPKGNYYINAAVDNQKLSARIVNYVYVDPIGGSDDNGGFSWDSAVQSISKALTLVPVNGRIYLADGTHYVNKQINIIKALTVIGNGSKTVISNNYEVWEVFAITADNVAIYNCTFANNTAWRNAIIFNLGVNLTVSGCIFVDNSEGKAIYSSNPCSANDNWWGTNNPDWRKLVNNNVTRDTYAVLNLKVTDDKIDVNFYKNGTSTVLPISRIFTLAIGNDITTEKIVNGTFTKAYKAPKGNYIITASVDNQKLAINFINNIYVDPVKGNDANTGANWSSAVQSIGRAISLVPVNGRIYLAGGTHEITSQISINKAVTIVGNKTIITNNKKGNGLFKINADNVAIYNCTFANNNVQNYECAIIYNVNGVNLTVVDCSFVNNYARYYGGAIYNLKGANLTVVDCSFVYNSAEWGGAISNYGVNLTVVDCSFVNNSARIYSGGAISSNGVNLIVVDCSFVHNLAPKDYGGAIYNGAFNFTLDNCSFINNSAETGGAVCNNGVDVTMGGCSFVNNSASFSGGAIYNDGSNCSVINSKFDNNTLYRGVIYNGRFGTTALNNNTYSGLKEGQTYIYNSGGALWSVNITGLENKTFKAHPGDVIKLSVSVTCDGVAVSGKTLKFLIGNKEYDATSLGNGTYSCNCTVTYFDEPEVVISASYNANEVYVKNATLYYSIETFTDLNKAIQYSNNILLNSNVTMTKTEEFAEGIKISKGITINGNGFTIDANNSGRIFNIAKGATVSLNNVTLSNSAAGAIFNNGNLILNNVNIGDAIYNSGDLTLNNNTYSETGKTNIYNEGIILSPVSITVLENKTLKKHFGENITLRATITSDGASVAGGVLNFIIDGNNYTAISKSNGEYVFNYTIHYFNEFETVSVSYANATEVSVKNATLVCVIETFTDLQNAINLFDVISLNSDVIGDSNFTVGMIISKDITIDGNGYTIDAKKLGRIFCIDTGFSLNLVNVTLANGNYTGGAIFNAGNLTLNNVNLINNTGFNGGAIYNILAKCTIINSTFINNSANWGGGAIFNDGCNATVTDSVFSGDNIGLNVICNNEGIVSLNNNTYSGIEDNKTYIYNLDMLSSCVITVLENKTIKVRPGENITLYATITCDGASVTGGILNFTIDGNNYTAISKTNGEYVFNYTMPYFNGSRIVSASYAGATEVSVKNAEVVCVIETFTDLQNAINLASVISLNNDVKMTDDEKTKFEDGIFISKNTTIKGNGFTIDARNLGRIFNISDGCYLNLINVTLANGNSTIEGGAINSVGNLTLNNVKLINNTASMCGGAIIIWNSSCTINACVFINNTAGYSGGAIANFCDGSILTNSIFINNTAKNGGAICNWGDNSTVNDSVFVNNTVGAYGGTINNSLGLNLTVSNSIFTTTYGVDIVNNFGCTINLVNNSYSETEKVNIYNEGIILSQLTITVLENQTVRAQYGGNVELVANIITSDGANVAGGLLNFTIGTNNYPATSLINGTYNYAYSTGFVGKQVVSAVYDGGNNIFVKTGTLDVKTWAIIDVGDVVMTYMDESRLVAKLTDYLANPIANATLYFTINGKTYNKTTDANGSASIGLNLESGKYLATITYNGSDIYYNVSKNATVTVNPSIIANDLVKMYQNDTQFYATFLGKHGEVLANTTVKFNINGVLYNRTTNASGVAKLNINLRPGNYTLTAYNPVTGEELGFNVLVKSLIIASDLTKYYNNASQFEAKIYDKNGSLAVNKTVTFNIHGVLYNRTTDENGSVSLAIGLNPDDYVITTIVDGLEVSNNVKVLPTLITSDLTMNYHDGSAFNATVLDGQGNPLANQTVKFNVNGKFYSKITGNDGVASLNINLNRGEYIITSMWNDYQVGNNITIY